MRLSNADFRPGKRKRFVPSSGTPRRKIPVIRIALLVALALFVYGRFDTLWPRLRAAANPVVWWRAATGNDAALPMRPLLAWSRDSSRVGLECPRGLTRPCCESLAEAAPGLCGEAKALLARARWADALDAGGHAALRLEARSVVSELGDWGYELSAARGRDGKGAYQFRKDASGAWCDARRGCLGEPRPRAPLAGGRLLVPDGAPAGTALWTASGARVLAALPGRVMAVDSLADGARVRVYHGAELYVDYGPLRPAEGVRPGALVRAGSHLGDAPARSGRYGLRVTVRQAGRPLDAAAFWGRDGDALGLLEDSAATATLLAGAPR